MRAVILAFDHYSSEQSHRIAPPFLLPLIDRPFVQHVVENLIDAGITQFDILVDERTHRLSSYFGGGERWGCLMRYYRINNTQYPFACLGALTRCAVEEPILLATADALPTFTPDEIVRMANKAGQVGYACQENRMGRHWSGWTLVAGKFLASLKMAPSVESVSQAIRQTNVIRVASDLLHADSYADLLAAQRCLIREKISQRAWIHPSAVIEGPVYIGDHARIEQGARLGPNVVIGAHTYVGAETTIQDSLVCPRTYVGDGLEVNHMILDGKELFHATLNASMTMREPIFLSRVAV